jgi:hypothetical protein
MQKKLVNMSQLKSDGINKDSNLRIKVSFDRLLTDFVDLLLKLEQANFRIVGFKKVI